MAGGCIGPPPRRAPSSVSVTGREIVVDPCFTGLCKAEADTQQSSRLKLTSTTTEVDLKQRSLAPRRRHSAMFPLEANSDN